MILRPRPHGWQLLYILRGSIVPAVAPKVLAIGLLALVVAAFAELWPPTGIERVTVAPFSLLGLVLSVFLSFRNNACHERWWEARKLWGQLIHESRSLSRLASQLLAEQPQRRQRIGYLTVGFAHVLAARLRRRDLRATALPWLPDRDPQWLDRRGNVPDQMLGLIAAELTQTLRAGQLDPYLYGVFEARLQAMAAIQAGCERIAATPLPFAYTLLLHRCAWLFCVLLPFGLATTLGWATPVLSMVMAYAFFGLDQIGEELEEPFGLAANDLPIDALVRTIEIDQREALGERDLPPPLLPRDYVLH